MKRLRDAWLVLTGRAEIAPPVTFNGAAITISGISRGHFTASPGITFGGSTLGFYGTDQKES